MINLTHFISKIIFSLLLPYMVDTQLLYLKQHN